MGIRPFLTTAMLILVGAVPPKTQQVSTQRMSEITHVLASDCSRDVRLGPKGKPKTIPYLIGQFKAAGLEPAANMADGPKLFR